MDRRSFLGTAGRLAAGTALGSWHLPDWSQEAGGGRWRTFELTTHVDVRPTAGPTRIWVPLPLAAETPFQRPASSNVQCVRGECQIRQGIEDTPGMAVAKFRAGEPARLTLTSRVQVRDWKVDLQTPTRYPAAAGSAQVWLRPTHFVPTDGIVQARSRNITQNATTDQDKARAVYEWVVAKSYRKSTVRGCGKGDVRSLLESGDLGGKCADLNALFVGLARASALPARDVYGIRVAPSQLGYQSLGPSTGNVTKAQHCRAQVWLQRFGWVPVDPADVRKVILEEPPGNLPLTDPKVEAARQRLFGAWEMNWIAFNYAQDVRLPGSSGPPLPFFMYPEAETAGGRLDNLDPDAFRYQITAREIL